jgi:hypothetical protein
VTVYVSRETSVLNDGSSGANTCGERCRARDKPRPSQAPLNMFHVKHGRLDPTAFLRDRAGCPWGGGSLGLVSCLRLRGMRLDVRQVGESQLPVTEARTALCPALPRPTPDTAGARCQCGTMLGRDRRRSARSCRRRQPLSMSMFHDKLAVIEPSPACALSGDVSFVDAHDIEHFRREAPMFHVKLRARLPHGGLCEG